MTENALNTSSTMKLKVTCGIITNNDMAEPFTLIKNPDQIKQKRTLIIPVDFPIYNLNSIKETYIDTAFFHNVCNFPKFLTDALCEALQITHKQVDKNKSWKNFACIDYILDPGIDGLVDHKTHGIMTIPEIPEDFDLNSLVEPLQQKIYETTVLCLSKEQKDSYELMRSIVMGAIRAINRSVKDFPLFKKRNP